MTVNWEWLWMGRLAEWSDDVGDNSAVLNIDTDYLEIEHEVATGNCYGPRTVTAHVDVPLGAVIALLENAGYSVSRDEPGT